MRFIWHCGAESEPLHVCLVVQVSHRVPGVQLWSCALVTHTSSLTLLSRSKLYTELKKTIQSTQIWRWKFIVETFSSICYSVKVLIPLYATRGMKRGHQRADNVWVVVYSHLILKVHTDMLVCLLHDNVVAVDFNTVFSILWCSPPFSVTL